MRCGTVRFYFVAVAWRGKVGQGNDRSGTVWLGVAGLGDVLLCNLEELWQGLVWQGGLRHG